MIDLALFLLLSALAIVLLALPFLRRRAGSRREAFDLAVYQDQLSELERDHERGVIDAEATRAAKLEIERRILALAGTDASPKARTQSQPTAGGGGLAAGLVLVVPIAAGLLYVELGKPSLRDLPLASRPAPEQQLTERDSLLANIEQLEQHLETTPDNAGVWAELGRTRLRASLFQEAVEAFRKSADLSDDDPNARAELAEAMVYAAGGQVTPAAIEEFRKALEKAPNEPRGRYYLGLALAQEGETDAAIEGWTQLLEASPADAPWRPRIVDAIRTVLEADGRPTDDVIAALPKGSETAASETAAGAANTDEPPISSEQIRGMVEGLAARLENEPDDIQGWLMLGRSRLVLEETELAQQAFEKARELAPDNLDVLRAYAASLLGAPHPETDAATVGMDAVDLYEKIIALEPDDPEAHWYLGLAAVQDGTIDDAKTHWQRVLNILGPDHPNYAAVQSSLEQVETRTE